MIAGVPGAGISALFYLLCVLLMPFVLAWRVLRTRALFGTRGHLVARQLAIGGGIVVGLLLGGALVTLLAVQLAATPASSPGAVASAAVEFGLLLGRLGILFTVLTLVLVLGTVQLVAIVDRLSRPRPVPVMTRLVETEGE